MKSIISKSQVDNKIENMLMIKQANEKVIANDNVAYNLLKFPLCGTLN